MGNTWTVSAWLECGDADEENPYGRFEYIEVYAGEDIFDAMKAAKQAKDDGAGCVKIEWR